MLEIDKLRSITVGRLMDNLTHQEIIDISAWRRKYPELTKYRIEATSPDGIHYLPGGVEVDGDLIIWTITNVDTAVTGDGTYQVVGIGLNDEKKSSAEANFKVLDSMANTPVEERPDPSKPWVDKLIGDIANIENRLDKVEDEHVKTVNGIEPDDDGNINVRTGGVFTVNVWYDKGYKADKTYQDIIDAMGRAMQPEVLFASEGSTFNKYRFEYEEDDTLVFRYFRPDLKPDNLRCSDIVFKSDGTISSIGKILYSLELNVNGKAYEYYGGRKTTVDINTLPEGAEVPAPPSTSYGGGAAMKQLTTDTFGNASWSSRLEHVYEAFDYGEGVIGPSSSGREIAIVMDGSMGYTVGGVRRNHPGSYIVLSLNGVEHRFNNLGEYDNGPYTITYIGNNQVQVGPSKVNKITGATEMPLKFDSKPTEDVHIEVRYFYPDTTKLRDDKYLPGTVPVVKSAQVGQAAIVKKVNAKGEPVEWEAGEAGGGISAGTMIVNATLYAYDNTVKTDKTFEEIKNALDTGVVVELRRGGTNKFIYRPTDWNDTTIQFEENARMPSPSSGAVKGIITVNSDGTAELFTRRTEALTVTVNGEVYKYYGGQKVNVNLDIPEAVTDEHIRGTVKPDIDTAVSGMVKSINGVVADEDGNVVIEIPEAEGAVKSVNGAQPDENGDVTIEIPEVKGTVKSVNGVEPDESGNVVIEIPEIPEAVTDKHIAEVAKTQVTWENIPDKPFGAEGGGIVLPPVTTSQWGDSAHYITQPFTLEEGKNYLVTWNGTVYPCTAQSVAISDIPCVAVGNISDEEDGIPFVIVMFPAEVAGQLGAYGLAEGEGIGTGTAVTFMIEGGGVKKLDVMYLPDEIVGLIERVAALEAGGSGGGSLTVDGEGNAVISAGFNIDADGNATI